MNARGKQQFQRKLNELEARIRGDLDYTTEELRQNTAEESGDLSHVPLHPADVGTEEFLHELNAVLVGNQEHLVTEIQAARQRLAEDRFGICERCQQPVPAARLEALPYVRYCVPCAEVADQSLPSLDDGRPASWSANWNRDQDTVETGGEGTVSLSGRKASDPHAAGTPAGGTAMGGLAGSPTGDGEPVEAALETEAAGGRSQTGRSRGRAVKHW